MTQMVTIHKIDRPCLPYGQGSVIVYIPEEEISYGRYLNDISLSDISALTGIYRPNLTRHPALKAITKVIACFSDPMISTFSPSGSSITGYL